MKYRRLITIISLTIFLALLPISLAQIQSHPLSQITPIDVDLDMYQKNIINVSNLGIGTTNPSYNLHVVGNAYISDGLVLAGNLDLQNNLLLNTKLGSNLNANGYSIIGTNWVNATNVNVSNQLCLGGICKTSWPSALVGGSGATNYIAIWTDSSNLGNSWLYQSGSDLVLSSSHNFNLESGSLKIGGATVIDSSRNLANVNQITANGPVDIDSGTLYVDSSNDRVGIGTNSPQAKLDIEYLPGNQGTIAIFGSSTRVRIIDEGPGLPSGVAAIGPTYGLGLYATAGPLRFFTGGTTSGYERMRIDTSGNVGIGTTNPTYRLTIVGDINATGFVKGSQLCIGNDCRNSWPDVSGESGWTDEGTYVRLTTSSDKVIIGADYAPKQKLDIVGNLNVTGNIYEGNQLLSSKYVDVSGDTMTGNLNMADNNILNANTIQVNNLEDPEDTTLQVSDNLYVTGSLGVGVSPSYKIHVSGAGKNIVEIESPQTSSQAGIRFFRTGTNDYANIYIENYSGNVNLHRLVIESSDDGDSDYIVFRNHHWDQGDKDVMEIHRSYIAVNATLRPLLNNYYDLGTSSYQWANIYGVNVYQNGKQVIDTINSGNGISVSGSGNSRTIAIKLYSGSGLIADSTGLSLNRSCSAGQVLKWNGNSWYCAEDENSGGTVSGSGSANALAYWQDSSTLADLSFGSSGQFLKSQGSGNLPVWDTINLGADTEGNYVATLTAGTGISITGAGVEAANPTISIDTNVVPQKSHSETISGVWNFANGLKVAGGYESGGLTIDDKGNILTHGNLTYSGYTYVINTLEYNGTGNFPFGINVGGTCEGSGYNGYINFKSSGDQVKGKIYTDGSNLMVDTDSYGSNLKVKGNVLPATTQTYDLGSNSLEWSRIYAKDAYFSGTVHANAFEGAISANNVEDIWVNETGDTMTGSLTIQGNNMFTALKLSGGSLDIDVGIDSTRTVEGVRLHGPDTSFFDFGYDDGTSSYVISEWASGGTLKPIRIRIGGSDAITITTDSNVGIGTTTPGTKLDVAGEIRGTVFKDRDNTGYYLDPASASNIHSIAVLSYAPGGSDSHDCSTGICIGGTSGEFGMIRKINQDYATNVSGKYDEADLVLEVHDTGNVNPEGDIVLRRIGSYANDSADWYMAKFGGEGNFLYGSTYLGIGAGLDNSHPAPGNVGIGTTNPQYKLDVSGSGRFTGDLHVGGTIYGNVEGSVTTTDDLNMNGHDIYNVKNVNTTNLFASNAVGIGTSTVLNQNIGAKLDVKGNGADFLIQPGYLGNTANSNWVTLDVVGNKNIYIWDTLAVSGKVGIGTTSPASKLDVYNPSGNSSITIRSGTASWYHIYQPYNKNQLRISVGGGETGSTDIMTFSGSKVGIGTTSPGYTLDVAGTIKASSDVRAPIFYDSDNTGYYINPAGTSIITNLRIKGWDAKIQSIDSQTGYMYDLIGTYHGWNPNWVYIAGYNVKNNPNFSNATAVAIGGSGSTIALFDIENQKVGIGTTNPDSKLDIVGPNPVIRFGDSDTDTHKGRLIAGGTYVALMNKDNKGIAILQSNGNVGIGTTSPSYKLTVIGDINATGFVKGSQLCIGNDCRNSWPDVSGESGWTDEGTYVRLTTSSDKVIIGADYAPKQKLDIVGNLNVTGASFIKGTLHGPYLITMGGDDQGIQYTDCWNGDCSVNVFSLFADTTNSVDVSKSKLRVGGIAVGNSTSLPSSEGEIRAVSIYQNGKQVIDTINAGNGISVSGSGNSRTIAIKLYSGSGLIADSTGLSLNRSCSAGQVLKWNGNSWYCANDENSGGTVSGSGSAGQVAFWTGSSSISGDNNLYWDNSNKRLGIGTSSPSSKLFVNGGKTRIYSTDNAGGQLQIGNSDDNEASIGFFTGVSSDFSSYTHGWVVGPDVWGIGTNRFGIGSYGGPYRVKLTVDESTGNVGIGTTSPGAKLDVEGGVEFDNLETDVMNKIVPIYIRGTGLNNNANRILKIGSTTIYDTTGRGLRFTVISKSDYSVLYDATFDTYGSSTASDLLADNITKRMNKNVIGILTSWDAWEAHITANLKNAFKTCGLYKALMTPGGMRRPYAAIFECNATIGTGKAVEVLHSNDANQPYAEIRGWLIDGSFVASGDVPNALSNNLGTQAVVVVDESNRVGIGTTSPDSKLHVIGGVCIEPSDTGCTTNGGELKASTIYQSGNKVLDTSTNFDGDVSGTYNNLQLKAGVVGNTEINDNTKFVSVQNSGGTEQFAITDGNNALQFAAGDGININFDSANHRVTIIDSNAGNEITGSGSTNYVAKFTGSNTIGNSQIYDDGSNVGIGTTSPGAKLEVSGNVKINHDGALSATNGNLVLYHPTSGSYSAIVFPSKTNYGSDYGYIKYEDDDNTYNYWGDTSENSALVIGVQNDGRNSVSDVVVLKSPAAVIVDSYLLVPSGNVGIGTTSPSEKLEVDGNIKLSSSNPVINLNGVAVKKIGSTIVISDVV